MGTLMNRKTYLIKCMNMLVRFENGDSITKLASHFDMTPREIAAGITAAKKERRRQEID